ncbi:hypothetical protein ABZ863_02130 [Saccharomonospora sp. NPDC046836]|uniref:hypothetical protein n=1 Tax=Saccharomonospora sp. NPDC046836 TaxID=3156921 RepID=UPI0033E00F4E
MIESEWDAMRFRLSRETLLTVSAAMVLGAALFLVVKDSLTDDAYITLAYAKNLATHGEWGLVPGSPANSATSPLNILLLGGLTALTRLFGSAQPVLALGVLNVLASGTLGWAWARLIRTYRLPLAVGLLGLLVVLVNPFVLSAIGLEVLLIPAVLMLLTVFAVEGRPVWFGVAAGLAVLTRLDLIVFVLVIAICTPAIRRKLLPAALVTIAVAGPWYVFSWFAFGSAVPDTLVIKQSQDGLFGRWDYLTGPMMYYFGQKAAVTFTFGIALLGLVVLIALLAVRFGARWTVFPPVAAIAGLGIGGVAYYVAYSLLGVGPYHWYYVAPTTALASFAVLALGVWFVRARQDGRLRVGTPSVALGLVVVLALGTVYVDARRGVPWKSPVIFGNWASSQDYARVGMELGKRLNGATVLAPGEIGTLAYYCECSIVDVFSDRGRVVDLIDQRIDEAGPATAGLLRFNYLWFDYNRAPRPLSYRLLYDRGPGSGPDTWQVYSAARGIGHFTLVPVPPQDAEQSGTP